MPKRSNDASTVHTGTSSLRNLDYEPSQQGSVDDGDSASERSDGASAMSSVVSSVKRDLKARASKGTFSSQSVSTRQSNNAMMWQDSVDEDELYSTSTDEEEEQQIDASHYNGSKKQHSSERGNKGKDHDTDTLESTEDPTSDTGSEYTHGDDGIQQRPKGGKLKAPVETRAQSKPSKPASSLKKKKKTSRKGRRKDEPLKKLRFSTEALAEAAHSRIYEDRHERHQKPEPFDASWLQNVDYVSEVDVASTNQDLSTLHPLGKEECQEVFKNRVPFEVPMPEDGYGSDDMSSIHALSTKLQAMKFAQDQHREHDIEEGTLHEVSQTNADEEPPASKEGTEDLSSPQQDGRLRAVFMQRGTGELVLSTIAGASLAALVVLLVMLFAT
ncbi:expressed unknown protein [Seminavis robusta]|uniref:Uncharacterized protein n=1 Tax=Seminavis robusta TaxID=568900 RepID=A0A9N8HKT0_9STRA|nr:expressed unknown protein [Seminavis robusta]|eukprot:Sro634_g179000.1 n/a (386) ;mRNA; r:30102-31259